ncbi:amidohydrolase family protein [Ovoidimarina sediminis]|uniref:amidohydrolase family protein n=1 Tax=Ovoidimarina sediminis TaxID=3079856 RepID=UPI00290659BE|nr:amidohydrolase family protein [Rhodophyticola sp. MJ-SS7]MDU8942793.1 amidohydrolase family protein [Rhodophyticola sp. MJ-SS7]
MRIDAHHHLWQPGRGDYGWMPKDNAILNRRYGPEHLAETLAGRGIGKTVLVQAAATVDETEYMLGLADATEWIAGVVGWVDFEDKGARATLERLAGHPKFKGVRPMIQDIPDVDWMLRDEVQWGYAAVTELGLTFDALGYPEHLGNFLTILTRYPEMRVVVDHCMKPRVRDGSEAHLAEWAEGMRRIAGETGAFCKFSGLVTEADEGVGVGDLRPYAEVVLEAFGPDRVMWGSDWPVCRLRAEYDDWLTMAEALTEGFGAAERAEIFGGSAARFYGL